VLEENPNIVVTPLRRRRESAFLRFLNFSMSNTVIKIDNRWLFDSATLECYRIKTDNDNVARLVKYFEIVVDDYGHNIRYFHKTPLRIVKFVVDIIKNRDPKKMH
jgi:hypothetical protein